MGIVTVARGEGINTEDQIKEESGTGKSQLNAIGQEE
jgi:hypothetical protein